MEVILLGPLGLGVAYLPLVARAELPNQIFVQTEM